MSRLLTLSILSICLLSSNVLAALYGTAGVGVGGDATANTRATFTFNAGAAGILESSLAVTASVDCKVFLDLYINAGLSAMLPSGVVGGSSFATSLAVGFTLSASNGATLTTPTLTTPELDATLAAAITGNVNAAVLKFDTSLNTFVRIKLDSYTVSSKKIVVTLPGAGTYVIVGVNEVVSLNYAVVAPIFASANRTYNYGSEFAVKVATSSSNSLTVIKSSSTTKPSNLTLGVALNIFFQITLATANPHESELRYTYTDAQLIAAGLAASGASRLKFAYYSDAQAKWIAPPGAASVDTTAKVIIQSTTTFSEWGVYYENSCGSLRASVWVVMGAIVLPMLSKFF